MPNQNVRYPLVAIPKCIFNALQQDMSKDYDNPYARVTVNEYVQSYLNHAPMYDYLLRMVQVSNTGERTRTGLVGDPTLEVRLLDMSLKKVRVTESQFEMLSQRQAQYARDGLRIPISCIVSSMLYQWSESVQVALEARADYGYSMIQSCYPEAWMYGDVKGSRCRGSFFRQDDASQWRSYSWERDTDQITPNVIVGWTPLGRALRGANLRTPEDE